MSLAVARAMAGPPALPSMRPEVRPAGGLVAIVGPSGAGKDSLIALAREALAGRAGILFVRRAITRPGEAGGEEHEPMTEARFAACRRAGAFCVDWQAHGLSYGIRREVAEHVRRGGLAVMNGSRHALPAIAATFPVLQVVEITASAEVLASRLAARGRETREAIAARLARPQPPLDGPWPVTAIDNSGILEEAGDRLVALLRERAGEGRPPR